MRHQQYRKAVRLPEGFNQILHLDPRQGIKRAERFIKQQQAGTMNQRACQGHALLLSTRQGRRPLSRAILQPYRSECLPGVLPPAALQAQPDVIHHRFPRQQTRVLKHHARIILNRGQRRSACQNVTAVWRFQPG